MDNLLFRLVKENSYSYYSTILLYGFSEYEKNILDNYIRKLTINDPIKNIKCKIKIYDTNLITDILGIPFFMAFINFKDITSEDTSGILEYFNDIEEPLSDEMIDMDFSDENYKNPIVYAVNYNNNTNTKTPECFILNNDIFDKDKNLRLSILSEIKNIEGLGVASTNSIRLYRVLSMYKCLFNEGAISKNRTDELIYPETISKSMFFRDIRILKEIEFGNLIYDKKINAYILRERRK